MARDMSEVLEVLKDSLVDIHNTYERTMCDNTHPDYDENSLADLMDILERLDVDAICCLVDYCKKEN